MRLLGLDFETTGLDTAVARVVEIGACIWDVESKRPLTTVGIFLWDEGIKEACNSTATNEKGETPRQMMLRVSGITPEVIQEFGTDAKRNFEWLEDYVGKHKIDYLVAHNGEGYDRPLLLAELDRHGLDAPTLRALPWIDTRIDLPFASEPDSRKLKHLALDCGFINPFAHRAVFDVLTMLRVLSNYPLQDVLEYKKIPSCIVRAIFPAPWTDDGVGKKWANGRRYSWERCGDRTFPKCWVKQIKLPDLDAEMAAAKQAGYEVVRLK